MVDDRMPPILLALFLGYSLDNEALTFNIDFEYYLISGFKWELAISCNFHWHVEEIFIVYSATCFCWSVDEFAFALNHFGIPNWYHIPLVAQKGISNIWRLKGG